MGTRTSYGPGTFCWANLSTTDVNAAKGFYAELLGWDYDDRPADDGAFSMARRYDANVAAIYPREEQEREQGQPPHWNNYVSVDDTDVAAVRAKALGGSVLAEPFDVSDAGRTALITDPAGAMFWLWQPRRHIGAGRVNDAGCLAWNELSTNATDRAMAFYSTLFGWRFERMSTDGGPAYWAIHHDAAAMGINGGLRELSDSEARSVAPAQRWMPYFTVGSAVSTADKARMTGGNILHGTHPIGAARSR
jgi:uncharacterized protein